MRLRDFKQKLISRRNRRAKRRLTKKPKFLKIWLVLLLILLIPSLVVEWAIFFLEWKAANLAEAYFSYPYKVLHEYPEKDDYKKGGRNYLELDYCDMEDQWEISMVNQFDGTILGMMTGNINNGYWCLYDLTNDCLLDEPQQDLYCANIWYRRPSANEEDVYAQIQHLIPVNKAQASFLSQFYLLNEEDGIAEYRLGGTGMNVTSAYIKDADFIINSYIMNGREYKSDLSELAVSLENYQYVEFAYDVEDKWSRDSSGYGFDGTYEISLDTIYNCEGILREPLRDEAMKVLKDYRRDLKEGNVESMERNGNTFYTKVYHSGIADRIKEKYRIVSSVEVNGTEYAIVLIIDIFYYAGQLYALMLKYALITLLIGIAVAFLPALLLYQRRKLNYQLYQYRSNLTDNMAKALKAPLEEISESINGLSQDNTKDGQYTAEISERINYMNGLITNLLELSKNDSVTVKERMAFVLTDVIGDEFIGRMKEDGILVTRNGDVKVNANRPLFEKAVERIMEALCFYSSDKRIQVEAGGKEILFSCNLEDRTVTAEELLEPFSMGTESTDERNLSLPVAKSMCDANGFRMSISIEDKKLQIKIVL